MSTSTLEESLFTTRYRVYTAVNEPVPHRAPSIASYSRRWYIAGIFASLCLMQGIVWSTWWYMADVTELIYGWTTSFHAGITFASVGVFVLGCSSMWQLVSWFGRSSCTILVSLLLTAVAGLRCIPSKAVGASIMAVLSSAAAGFSATLTFTAPTAISAAWFPSHQRTLATGMMTLTSGNLALSASYVFPALMLPSNITVDNDTSIPVLQHEVDRMLTVEFLFCLVVSVCVIAYFPAAPPLPPSSMADLPRTDVKKSVKYCVRSSNFWLTLLARGLPLSSQLWLLGILEEVVEELEILPQRLGLIFCLAGLIGGLVFSLLADHWWRKLKTLLSFLTAVMSLLLLLATLTAFSQLSTDSAMNTRLFRGFFITAGVFSGATTVLFAEFACELTYPAEEMVVNSLQFIGIGVLWSIFYGVHFIPGIGSDWVLPVLTAASVVSFVVLLFVKSEYRRQAIDLEDERGEPILSVAT